MPDASVPGPKPRALVIAARFPGHAAPMAGHRICAAHIANVAEHYLVDLFVVCRDTEDFGELECMRSLCARVHVVTITKLDALKSFLTHPFLPLPAAARSSGRIARELVAFADATYDLAHFEWTETAYLATLIPAKHKQIMCHDILSELFARRSSRSLQYRLFWSWQMRNARRFESTCLPPMDRVFTLSKADAGDLAEMGVPGDRLSIIAPEFYRSQPVARHWDGSPRNLLLWGAFSREENREAATILLRDIMPRLKDANVRLLIAGSESDKYYTSGTNVQVLGWVADPAKVFDMAHLGVYPLYQGSGLKIKVLEALYAGLPVVTTSVGKEGYECGDDDGLFMAETPDVFVDTIKRILANRVTYEAASAGAARWSRSFIEGSRFGVV